MLKKNQIALPRYVMRNRAVAVAVIAIATAITPVFGEDAHKHEHGDEVKLTPQAAKDNGVKIATAKSQVVVQTVMAPARVAFNAEEMAHVGTAVTGRIAELKVRTGDKVSKGDVLFVVDSPELGEAQSEYLQRQSMAAVAAPLVELAKNSYERAKKLYDETQGTSLSEVQKRETELRTAEGNAVTSRASAVASLNRLMLLGMTQEEITLLQSEGKLNPRYAVRAPIDGQVIQRDMTLGELVSPNREKLLTIANLTTVWVLADVTEAQLASIATGSKVRITGTSIGESAIEGTVAFIAPELEASTRTARVRIEVANPQQKLRPGMFVQAAIAVSDEGGAMLAVPEEAVQTVEGEPAVFVPVPGEKNTFAKRAVAVGTPASGVVPVLAGLKEGEAYVAQGSFILKAEIGKEGAAHEH